MELREWMRDEDCGTWRERRPLATSLAAREAMPRDVSPARWPRVRTGRRSV
jgi:hypothetical protein